MAGRLAGRVALITGAASGIGKASAVLFAAEGARVVIADMDARAAAETAKELPAASGAVAVGDVSQTDDARGMVATAVEKFGRLDIVVNSAGLSKPGTAVDMSEADWRSVFDVNLNSIYLVCKHAIPAMAANGGGAIVNIGSALGVVVGPGGKAAYSSSKAAVIHLTRCLAVDHAAVGIRANCVCPGPIDSPMFQRNPAALRERLAQSRPLKRLGRASEVAAAVLFLASEESSYVTGQALIVDGGGSIV